jgi:hypothetical protein
VVVPPVAVTPAEDKLMLPVPKQTGLLLLMLPLVPFTTTLTVDDPQAL